MGASIPSVPALGGSRQSIARSAPRLVPVDRGGLCEGQSIARKRSGPRRALQDVTHASAREQESSRSHREDGDHAVGPIEQHGVDGERHPERVDGATSGDEHRMPMRQGAPSPQAPDPLASGLGLLHPPPSPVDIDGLESSHCRRLSAVTDTSASGLSISAHPIRSGLRRGTEACVLALPMRRPAWARQDSNLRHEG